MKALTHGRLLAQELIAQGLIPKQCYSAKIVMSPNAALAIQYEVFVEREDLLKLAAAMQACADRMPKGAAVG